MFRMNRLLVVVVLVCAMLISCNSKVIVDSEGFDDLFYSEDRIWYKIESDKPYSGEVRLNDDSYGNKVEGTYYEFTFEDGYKVKIIAYENGMKAWEQNLKKGPEKLNHGVTRYYYLDSGELYSEQMYKSGKKVGKVKLWDKHGTRID